MDKEKRFKAYKEALSTAFVELGTSPEVCIETIKAMGIKGMKCDEKCCPLGNYLTIALAKTKLPSIKLILTNECVLVFENQAEEEDAFLGFLDYPRHVKQFVTRMDKDEWPELFGEDYEGSQRD